MNGQQDYTLNAQWRNRPDDERFTSMESLHDYVEARTDRARTFPSTSATLLPVPTEDGDIMLETERGMMGMTNYSFGQLCTTATAPRGYMTRLPARLACINLQYGMANLADRQEVLALVDDSMNGQRGGDTLSMDGGFLRALTSRKYGRIWDLDVVKGIMKVNEDGRWRVPGAMSGSGSDGDITKESTTLYASDRDIFCFLCDPVNPIEVDGDTLYRGFYTWNSEVGNATFGLAMFLYRKVCQNRIIWGQENYTDVRIRHTAGAPDRFEREGRAMLTDYAESSARAVEDTIRRAKRLEIGKSEDDIIDWMMNRRFTKGEAKMAIERAEKEEGQARSLMDIINGLTASARDIPYTADRVAVERKAGNLMKYAKA